MIKYFLLLIFITLMMMSLYSFSGGIIGTTRKNGNGCVCHSALQSGEVTVTITGPDTVFANDSAEYFVTIKGGPLIKGGTNISVRNGTLIPEAGLRFSNGELTHIAPLDPGSSEVKFFFKYKAPTTASFDTIYANGNSVNFNGFSTGDKWNFAPGKRITIIQSTGVINSNRNINGFTLEQNYPNPFNPNTIIKYQLPATEFVSLKIFNITGAEIMSLINKKQNAGSYEVEFKADNLAAGSYYYKLTGGSTSLVKKMIIIK